MPTWALWCVCLGLVLLRAVLAGAESALYGLSDLRARELKDEHPGRGGRILRVKTEREATAAAVRFGLVLCGFAAAGIAAWVPPRLVGTSLSYFADSTWLAWLTPLTTALLVAVVASLFDVAFRAYASAKPEWFALSVSWLLSATVTLLYPVMRLLVAPMNLVLKPFGTKVTFEAPPPPLEELEKLLAAKAARHEVDKGAPQLIRGVFALSDKTVRDVMVSRTDVVTVELTVPTEQILQLIAEENHSRIPVYEGDMDHIVGILHVRDLVPLMQNPSLIVMQDLIRPAVFVPWVKPIGDLLREMQKQKIHMAVVVDEYGGFMGIVTLEDILREIVGDIGDEFEVEQKPFEKQADGSFIVDATLPATDFARAFDFKLPEEGDFETLGGYVSSLAGAIPEVGEKYVSNGWTFVVAAKAGPRLERVKVIKPKAAPVPGEKKDSKPELGAAVPPGKPSPAKPS